MYAYQTIQAGSNQERTVLSHAFKSKYRQLTHKQSKVLRKYKTRKKNSVQKWLKLWWKVQNNNTSII